MGYIHISAPAATCFESKSVTHSFHNSPPRPFIRRWSTQPTSLRCQVVYTHGLRPRFQQRRPSTLSAPAAKILNYLNPDPTTPIPPRTMLATDPLQLVLQPPSHVQTERIKSNNSHLLWTRKEMERNLPP